MPGLVDCIELTFQHPACRRQWPSITGAEGGRKEAQSWPRSVQRSSHFSNCQCRKEMRFRKSYNVLQQTIVTCSYTFNYCKSKSLESFPDLRNYGGCCQLPSKECSKKPSFWVSKYLITTSYYSELKEMRCVLLRGTYNYVHSFPGLAMISPCAAAQLNNMQPPLDCMLWGYAFLEIHHFARDWYPSCGILIIF